MSSNFVGKLEAKAQEVAREDFQTAKVLVSEAAKSGSYLYPFKGIVYFFTHRALWRPLSSRLVPMITLSLGVVASMFTLTYLPQLAVMVFVNGPLAVLTTVLLVLNESQTLTNTLSRSFLIQDALLDTFDGTLVARDATNLVTEGRELKGGAGADPIARLGKILRNPFERLSPKSLIRHFMYLPLNFIPVVGTVLYILAQGRARGDSIHSRYFQLKKWSSAQRSEWLKEHSGPYAAFGITATLLEMIPFASILFSFTNQVGAALWAADIEAKSTRMTQSTAPELQDTAKKAE